MKARIAGLTFLKRVQAMDLRQSSCRPNGADFDLTKKLPKCALGGGAVPQSADIGSGVSNGRARQLDASASPSGLDYRRSGAIQLSTAAILNRQHFNSCSCRQRGPVGRAKSLDAELGAKGLVSIRRKPHSLFEN